MAQLREISGEQTDGIWIWEWLEVLNSGAKTG
jgi:hypothetical protein